MNLDRFLHLFAVRERKFYPLYIAQPEIIFKGAQCLLQMVTSRNFFSQRDFYKEINDTIKNVILKIA